MSEYTGSHLTLAQQLERSRFERALGVCDSLIEHRSQLSTGELARLNQIVTGRNEEDPWRAEATSIQHRSGRTFSFAVMADPVVLARQKLSQAFERSLSEEQTDAIEAAIEIYTSLVLSHVFRDGNRRTAALAAHYFLNRAGIPLNGLAIHELGAGDLRDGDHVKELSSTLRQMAQFALRRV